MWESRRQGESLNAKQTDPPRPQGLHVLGTQRRRGHYGPGIVPNVRKNMARSSLSAIDSPSFLASA